MSDLKLDSPLVSVQWLNEHRNDSSVVILDATLAKVGQTELPATAATDAIPGARVFDLKDTFRNTQAALPNTAPEAVAFQTETQRLGINSDSTVVIYDHHGVYSAPRAWWLFLTMGHDQVAVLNGGLPAWLAAGYETTPPAPYDGPAGNFLAQYRPELLADADEVLDAIDDAHHRILDARSPERFQATQPEPRPEMRGGHVPSSQNLPAASLVQEGKLLNQQQLQEKFSAVAEPEQKLLLSCGSGITACILALGAEVAGYKKKAVYDGSWAEWGASDFPIETGEA